MTDDMNIFLNNGHQNVQWAYDTHLIECTMAMKCYAVKVVACNTLSYCYLNDNGIVSGSGDIIVSANVNCNTDLQVVTSVNNSSQQGPYAISLWI